MTDPNNGCVLCPFPANATLNVLPPPRVHCQQITVSGKHLTVLKGRATRTHTHARRADNDDVEFVSSSVLNLSSQEDVCIRDVKILPNYNSSYLPMMPDGSVLVVDNVWWVHALFEKKMMLKCLMNERSCKSASDVCLVWVLPCVSTSPPQPPVFWGHHGFILPDEHGVVAVTQQARCLGGAQLPVPAAAPEQSRWGLQRGDEDGMKATWVASICLLFDQ